MLFGKLFTNPKMWVNGNADDITMGGVYTCKDVQNVPTGDGALFVFKTEDTVKQVFVPVGEEGVVYTRVLGEEWASVTGTSEETEALIQSAIDKANQAQAKADLVDTRLNNIIVESGTSDAEVVAARTDSSGKTFTTLGQRLDTQFGEVNESLSSIVNIKEIDAKSDLTWKAGTFNGSTGTEATSATRLRSNEYLDISPYSSLSVLIDNGYKYAIYSYNSEYNYLASLSYTAWRTSELILSLPQNVKFLRFLVADTNDGTVSNEYSEKITISGTYNIISALKNVSPDINDYAGITLGWEIGSLQPTDGSELTSNTRIRSGKFFVGKGTRLTLTDGINYKHLLYMYSADGDYISSGEWVHSDITVERDAVIRILLAYNNNATISNVEDIAGKEIVSYSLPYTELLNSKAPAIYDIAENRKRKAEISVFKQKKTTSEEYGQCDLKMMFFTDVHGDTIRTQRMTDLINNWGVDYFDVAVCGGDIVRNIITDDVTWYYTATNDLSVPLLNVVGNHDAWANLNATLAPKTEVYAKFISPIVSKSAIIQPENAQANGYNYYYKDFGAVRVIVIDCMYWNSAQLSWFINTLTDAKNNNKHVLCVSHAAFPLNSMQKVDCLWSKSGVNTDNVRTNLEAAEAVKSYTDNGGIFVAWIVGHQHGDYVHVLNTYNQFVINLASFAQRAGWLLKNTEQNEYNYDCLTYVAIDTTNSIIKLMRIGADIDIFGTQYHGLVIDYANGDVISSY